MDQNESSKHEQQVGLMWPSEHFQGHHGDKMWQIFSPRYLPVLRQFRGGSLTCKFGHIEEKLLWFLRLDVTSAAIITAAAADSPSPPSPLPPALMLISFHDANSTGF